MGIFNLLKNNIINRTSKSSKPYKFIIFGVVLTIFFSVFSFLLINSKLDEIQVLNKSLESEKRINNTYKLNIKELNNRKSELGRDTYSLQLKIQTAVREAKLKSKIETTRAREEIERNERDANTEREAIIAKGEKEKKERLAKKEKKQLDELNRKYYPRVEEGILFRKIKMKCPERFTHHFQTTSDDYVEFLYDNYNDTPGMCPGYHAHVKAKIRGKIGLIPVYNLIKRN